MLFDTSTKAEITAFNGKALYGEFYQITSECFHLLKALNWYKPRYEFYS
jgi:hypothetical protein